MIDSKLDVMHTAEIYKIGDALILPSNSLRVSGQGFIGVFRRVYGMVYA